MRERNRVGKNRDNFIIVKEYITFVEGMKTKQERGCMGLIVLLTCYNSRVGGLLAELLTHTVCSLY